MYQICNLLRLKYVHSPFTQVHATLLVFLENANQYNISNSTYKDNKASLESENTIIFRRIMRI